MMDWGGPMFVVLLVAISTIGWLANNWIRAKHGYSLEDEWGGKTDRQDKRTDTELREQNAKLTDTLEKMQQRMIVLERIVTDKGYTVAEEIEALRDTREADDADPGVPLNLKTKENA